MVEGINYITDEKGNKTGVILDLIALSRNNVMASDVLDSLSGLQKLIDQAGNSDRKNKNWDHAKEQLKDLKPKKDK